MNQILLPSDAKSGVSFINGVLLFLIKLINKTSFAWTYAIKPSHSESFAPRNSLVKIFKIGSIVFEFLDWKKKKLFSL